MPITSPNPRFNTPPPVYDSHSQASTRLNPYLELRHLLSLTWLAYPILSLLFVAFRLELSSTSAQIAVSNAKDDLLTSCKAAEQAATAAASLPRYMAIATNQQITDAVNDTMDGARAALVLSLTMMEAIIDFVVDIYRSTFLCFLDLVLTGGLSLLISAVQEISSSITGTMNSIRTSIQGDVASANSAISSAINAINKVNPFGNINVPQFSIPSLSLLENVTIPTDFESALISLNSSLPTLSQLRAAIDNVIDTPFEDLKADINNTFGGLTFDASILPIPEQDTLSFCGDLDTSSVDDLGADLVKITKIGIVILIVLALILLAGNCALEWYKWRCLRRHLQHTREAWISDPTLYHSAPVQQSAPTLVMTDHNLLMLQASSSHPVLTRIANNVARTLRMTPNQQTHLHWFFHYVFHPPALVCFLIGFFGLLSVQLQLIAIAPLEAKYSAQVSASVTQFSNTIVTSVNASMFNQSSVYASTVNAHIDTIQDTINDGVFGWVNGTTTTLNDTLVAFYSEVQSAVASVFNGTPLENPVQDFVKCIIGSKVTALEDVLTFLHNNLNVDMPRVNESILVLSPGDVNEVSQPIALAAVGNGSNGNSGLVGRLVNTYVQSIKQERFMFGIFMGLWGIVVFMALVIIFWHSYGEHWVDSYKRRRWYKKQREGLAGITISYPKSANEKGGSEQLNLPSFTPMPSPRPQFTNPFRSSTAPQPKTPLSGNYPLNSLDPGFENNWDNFLDRTAPARDENVHADSGSRIPRKLTAIGRKAMGRERFVSDEERSRTDTGPVDESEEHRHAGWLQRITSKAWKKEDGAESSSTHGRTRPKLTIATDRTIHHNERDDLPPVDAATSPDVGPVSAWSVSPGPAHAVPWKGPFVSTKKPLNSTPPLRPKLRRDPSFPASVDSTYSPSAIVIPRPGKPNMPTPLAMPIHHGFERPIPPGTPRSPSPPPAQSLVYQTTYKYTLPTQGLAPPLDSRKGISGLILSNKPQESTTPVTRLLTNTHARASSNVLNPFTTPFDDEACVQEGLRPMNPFTTAVAL